jgi:hypothetical protein
MSRSIEGFSPSEPVGRMDEGPAQACELVVHVPRSSLTSAPLVIDASEASATVAETLVETYLDIAAGRTAEGFVEADPLTRHDEQIAVRRHGNRLVAP